MLVRIDGTACLMKGAHALWQEAQVLVSIMGGRIKWERLSRVDLCLDMPGQTIEPFRQAYDDGRYITRAKGRGVDEDGNGGLTLYIGKAPPFMRIYDKLAELKSKKDGMKRVLMAWHRWGGMDPDAATRVEFQLNREALKKRSVDSVADYFERRGDLADYLCTDWVRFTEEMPDRTHTTRAKTLAIWEVVREGFQGWAGTPSGKPLVPLPRELCEVSQLYRGIIGLGLTAAARQNVRIESEAELIRYVLLNFQRELTNVNWRERLRKKRVEYPSEF